MDTIDKQQEPSDDDDLDTLRSIIRQSLNEIANDIGAAMRDAHLNFPVGLTTPSSGFSIVTVVTPIDPSEDDWVQATAIVRQIVSEQIGWDQAAQPQPTLRNGECHNERSRDNGQRPRLRHAFIARRIVPSACSMAAS